LIEHLSTAKAKVTGATKPSVSQLDATANSLLVILLLENQRKHKIHLKSINDEKHSKIVEIETALNIHIKQNHNWQCRMPFCQ